MRRDSPHNMPNHEQDNGPSDDAPGTNSSEQKPDLSKEVESLGLFFLVLFDFD